MQRLTAKQDIKKIMHDKDISFKVALIDCKISSDSLCKIRNNKHVSYKLALVFSRYLGYNIWDLFEMSKK